MIAINNIELHTNKAIIAINHWLNSEGSTNKLIKRVYPNLDGIANDESAADLMALRDTLNSCRLLCEKSIERLTDVIDLYEKNDHILRNHD